MVHSEAPSGGPMPAGGRGDDTLQGALHFIGTPAPGTLTTDRLLHINAGMVPEEFASVVPAAHGPAYLARSVRTPATSDVHGALAMPAEDRGRGEEILAALPALTEKANRTAPSVEVPSGDGRAPRASVSADVLTEAGGSDTGRATADDILQSASFSTLAFDATLIGTNGRDTLIGGAASDEIYGRSSADLLDGKEAADLLEGESGVDTLLGGEGNDTLVGGLGADILTGGTGDDVFLFRSIAESGTSRDVLVGDGTAPAFDQPGDAPGDIIDLTLVDADATADGHQAFTWGGTTLKGKGYLWVKNSLDATIVYGNVDDDAIAELRIEIRDGAVDASAYGEADFALQASPASWTFISTPDLFNADYGDLSGGADPAIAAVFGADYAEGLIQAPGWTPGGPNSLNAAMAAVWKANVDLMVESAGGAPRAALIAGDLVGGRWPQNAANLKAMFGDASTTLEQDLDTAASVYYAWARKLWSQAGVDTLIASLGDHDIGDDPWQVGSPTAAAVNVMKQGFGKHMVDPLELEAQWNGVSTVAPEGLGQYDEASYLYQIENVLFVTVDLFQYEGGGAVYRDQAVSINVTGERLEWLAQVLDAAEIDPTVDHIIVQGHDPVLQPVDSLNSDRQKVLGGESSPFWQLLEQHGTNVDGKVRAYLAGEVHATTTIQDASSGIVQITHGHYPRAQARAQFDPTYIVFEVTEDTIVGTEYTIINDRNGRGTVFEVDLPVSEAVDTIGSGAIEIGTITIDVSTGIALTTVTGNLKSPATFLNFFGGNGDDTASDFRHGFGQRGNDTLDGGAGNDRLDGGIGNDVLIGGVGDDILVGGPGSDTFMFTASTAGDTDTIADFVSGFDTISIAALTFDDLQISTEEGNATVKYGLDTIKVIGLLGEELGQGDFIFI